MDDARKRVYGDWPPCGLTPDELNDTGLTFLGNYSRKHAHERLAYKANRKNGITIRNVLDPLLLFSLVPIDEPFFDTIENLFPEIYLATPSAYLLGGKAPGAN